MIGKVPRAGRGFKGLVSYLLRGEKSSADNPDRVAWTEVRNLASSDPELAHAVMAATARRNRRCLEPVYHFVISWRHDERPTEKIMLQVADMTCADLELEDYQRLYVAHADTRHRHLHVVVNRIHPETFKAWNRRQDWVRIEQSLADQSRGMGLTFVPGRHNEPEAALARNGPRRERDQAFQRRRRIGKDVELPRWSDERIAAERDGLAAVFDAAGSWEELDTALAERGMLIVQKGQGLVIADAQGSMKVSELGKGFGRKRLKRQMREGRARCLERTSAEDLER